MLGLRAYRQPDKSVQRLRDSILPLTGFLVLLDQRFAIEPYWPSFGHLALAARQIVGCPTFLRFAIAFCRR